MSNILFAWELGGNLGHLAKQMMIARALRQRGHRCLFAARDVSAASIYLAEDSFEIVQAPFHAAPEGETEVLSSYVDILNVNGFDPPGLLQRLVESWHAIFESVSPKIVVIDYSPIAVLAAKLRGISILRLDTGFGCPPNESPFPSFRPWLDIPVEQILEKELKLLYNINQVCSRMGSQQFTSLQKVLTTGMDLLTTFPELDSYTGRRFRHYIGPLFNISDGTETTWPEGSEPRVFVYLRPFIGLEIILKELAERSLSVIAAVPGIEPELAGEFSNALFQIIGNPVRLSVILDKMDLAVTHGGHGFANVCVLLGIPTISIPTMIEQLMTSQNLERLGAGIGVNHDQVAEKFAPSLDRMLTEQTFRENARTLAAKYADYDQDNVLENIADTIEGIIYRKTTISLRHNCSYSLPISCLPGAPAELLPCK